MSEMWNLETAQGTHGRAFFAALLVTGLVVTAASYVAAQTIYGHGSLSVHVVEAGYTLDVKFYQDADATVEITGVDVPLGGHKIVYAKVTNDSGNDYVNLKVGGGGSHLWMNVYTLTGASLYVNGNSVGSFTLEDGQSIVLKVDVGTDPNDPPNVNDDLTLGLDVFKE